MTVDPMVTVLGGNTLQDLQEKGGCPHGYEQLSVPAEDTGPSAGDVDPSVLLRCADSRAWRLSVGSALSHTDLLVAFGLCRCHELHSGLPCLCPE